MVGRELAAYPAVATRAPDRDGVGEDIVLPLELRSERRTLTFLSTISTFGTALDITLAELSIEAFYPADDETAAALDARRSTARTDALP